MYIQAMSGAPSSILWRSLDPADPSFEHLRLFSWTHAEGTVVGALDRQPFTLTYRVEIGKDSHPGRVELSVADGPTLTLVRAADGTWTDAAGQERPELNGCTDVDIRATPFTNSIPIRRLGLAVGQSGEIRATWVNVPTLELRVARQRYTRTGGRTYRYENLESGYTNGLTVDAAGLVTLYPEAFEQVSFPG